ncbi:LPD7 domain-containing protein [Rhodoblastus sp.]|uniref:LPD7 domain-containing protein n=1 Tax=Rhodoblastus sp. TaxID=1962975 RepID=UPI003F94B378
MNEIMDDLRRSLALSPRANVGFHHVTVNPGRSWTAAQRDDAIRHVLNELGATSHAWAAVEHSGKTRAMAGGDSTHFHLIVAHVGPDGRALDMRGSYARLEAVARTCEVDFGEQLTHSRRPAAVARHLSRIGRSDVAAALTSGASSANLPRSAMSSASRQRAASKGLDLPAARAAVRAAWESSDLAGTLAATGLRIGWGDRRPVPLVRTADGAAVGALDRLAGVSRVEAVDRLEAEMARPRKTKTGETDERKTPRGRHAAAGQARPDDLARCRRDEVDSGGDSGDSGAGRGGVPRPRWAGPDRGEARRPPVDPAAARRRRQRALAELRSADAAARSRARKGRTMAADVEKAKAALWKKLFGADLSPELVAALVYVDVRERLVKLTDGGWVRDEGDRMFASGGDPKVVALMVAAAQAKGWRAVRIWGDAEFLREARRQFEAAGIPVTVIAPPPDPIIERAEAPPAAPGHDLSEVVAEFRRRRVAVEARLSEIRQPAEPSGALVAARDAEQAADAGWREAMHGRDAAKRARDEIASELEKAGLLSRGSLRRRLAAAQAEYEAAREKFRDACERHDDLKAKADDLQRDFDKAERRRRAARADEERKAQAEAAFLAECERIAGQSAVIANQGPDAIEAAARARLTSRADSRLLLHAAAAPEDESNVTSARP